jgi:hypothetical protein
MKNQEIKLIIDDNPDGKHKKNYIIVVAYLKSFRLITIVVGELTRRLTEALILPFNCVTYAESLYNEFSDFEKIYKADFDSYQLDLNHLKWAISNFTRNAQDFHKRLNEIDTSKFEF